MTLKERIAEWAEKRDRRMTEQDNISSRYRRNRKYHSHFEGYTEYTQMQPNGHLKIIRTYTGEYYRADISTPRYVFTRIIYILLWIVAAVCQISATMADMGYNYKWYATVPEAFGFPAAFLMMILVFYTALAERNLKIRQYKHIHKTMPVIALAGSCIHLLTCLCMLLYIILEHSSSIAGIWLPPLKMLAASACFAVIWLIERNARYEILENPEKPAPGGVEIH